MTLSIMIVSKMGLFAILSIITVGRKTQIKMKLCKMGLFVTLRIMMLSIMYFL